MNPRPPLAPRGFRPTHLVQRRLRALGFSKRHEWLTSNLGKELGLINYQLIKPCGTPVTSAGGFELLCSYNWRRRTHKQQQPHIFVPGEAPGLVPHKLPLVTSVFSKGKSFRDVNAALMPAFPFEPMFRAAGVMRPGCKFDDVDLVINRSSLNHLLRLVDGGRCKNAFRLDLAMVKDTLIVTPLWERISDKGNYGRIFEQYFTRHERALEESQSHHRAILYNLGPLKIAVLCEVDAACAGILPSWSSANGEMEDTTPWDQTAPLEETLFGKINKQSFLDFNDSRVKSRVTHLGKGTLSARTAELATMKDFSKREKIPQMWLGRTPYLVESIHNANTFTRVRVTHCGAHLLAFEQSHQDALQKLVSAVKMLAHFTTRAPGRHGIAVCIKEPRTLRVFEAADKPESPVPPGIQRRFWSHVWTKQKDQAVDEGDAVPSRPAPATGAFWVKKILRPASWVG